jgi:hypothetical protein
MPQFGSIHDDSVYFVCAKAWATGQGHRIVSLPGQPWQTKYPPVYPMLLSVVWRIWPEFPQNLKLATAFSWVFLPLLLLLTRLLYRRLGFSPRLIWSMIAVLALNPYVQLFSTSLLSEVPFTVVLLGALLIAPRSAAMAGVLAGVAYLTRTAALPLLIAVPCLYAIKQRWRSAAIAAASMLPFLIGWGVWSGAHRLQTDDPNLMFYLDYARYEFFNVNSSNFLDVFAKNFQSLLEGFIAAIIPSSSSRWLVILAYTIAVATIIGVFRLARDREEARPYAIYAVLFSLMLVVWHYPPNGRFLFPVFPLLVAGFAYQMAQTVSVIRQGYADVKQRRAAIVFAAVLGVLAVPVLWANYEVMFNILASSQASQRAMRVDDVQCAGRMRSELPFASSVMAPNDPTMYLLTGFSAMRMTIAPIYWYAEGYKGMLQQYAHLPEVARSHGMTHLLVNRNYHWELPEKERAELFQMIDNDQKLQSRFICGAATLYAVP